MSATDTRLRGRTRWSAASKCSRWAALGLLGAEPAEASERTQRLFRRGRQLEADRVEMLRDKYGAENVIAQKAIEWPTKGLPLGELHVDAYVIPEKLSIEVKSATSPDAILDDAITQLAGEVHYDQESEAGALMIVDPTGWQDDDLIPVMLTSQLIDRVEQIAADVASAAKGGALPDCSCSTPGSCRGKGCPFTDEAWKDWVPPTPEELNDSEAVMLAHQLYERKQRSKMHEAEAAAEHEMVKELEAKLTAMGILPGRDYLLGPYKLKAISVKGRETLSLSTMRKTGATSSAFEALVAPFVKQSNPYTYFRVDRVGDERPVLNPVEEDDTVPF